MPSFEFLHPDKSPPNARKPKRKKAKNLQKEQPTRTPHPHNKIPPKFPRIHPEVSQIPRLHTPSFSCAKMPSFRTLQQSTPKFRNALKSKVSDYLKRPSKFPPIQQSTPKFHNAPKSKVSGYLKQPSKFPYTHEVREFLTIQRPQCTRPNTHITPRSLSGSLIASKIPHLSRENFTPWGSRPTTTRATANGR